MRLDRLFCAPYFLVIRADGCFAIITTNSVAQGKTRACGLDVIASQHGTISFAVPSVRWPGQAAVFVALVSVIKGDWKGPVVLNGCAVDSINTLLDEGEVLDLPLQLEANQAKSFIGNYVLGDGFILDHSEANQILNEDRKYEDVVFPYLIGDDINTAPDQSASRYVINLQEYPLEIVPTDEWEAASLAEQRKMVSAGRAAPEYDGRLNEFTACIRILEERVKKFRETCGDKRARTRWWIRCANAA